MSILIPVIALGILGLFFAVGLSYASKKFAVEIDPRIEELLDVLAGSNCGSCGYAGCRGYAESVVTKGAPLNLCAPSGVEAVKEMARIMGVEAPEMFPKVAVAQCQGGKEESKHRYTYHGIEDCRAAQMVGAGFKACAYGCLGLGSCATACPFDAISISANGLPIVDEDKCTACGICVQACPRGIMTLIPRTQAVYLGCDNKYRGSSVKKICTVGCTACKLCVKSNPKGAEGISMDENLPRINYEELTNWAEANETCPQKCFVIRKPTL